MIHLFLFFHILLLNSLFVSRSRVTCSSSSLLQNTPNLENDVSNSQVASFKERCSILNRKIKEFAVKQLGLETKTSIHFSDYNVENWPTLVPRRFINWDEQALVDLDSALQTMVFTKKTEGLAERADVAERQLLFDMLKDRFNEQIKGTRATEIPWKKYHVKGWPRDVSLQPKRWTFSEVLALYRHLNKIEFEPVLPGEEPTVTYADVKKVDAKSICTKRKRRDEEDKNSEDEAELNSPNGCSDSSGGSAEDSKDACSKNEQILYVERSTRSENDSGNYLEMDTIIEKDILAHLGRVELPEEDDINSWTRFLDLPNSWNEKVIIDLEVDHSKSTFKDKFAKNGEMKRNYKFNHKRAELSELLLKKFRNQTRKQDAICIRWSRYHLTGWPSGVPLSSSNWRPSEICAIYRNLEKISWEEIEGSANRIITYDDGTFVSFPPRKRACKRIINCSKDNGALSKKGRISSKEEINRLDLLTEDFDDSKEEQILEDKAMTHASIEYLWNADFRPDLQKDVALDEIIDFDNDNSLGIL